MAEVLDPRLAPHVEVDEAAIRRQLRDQVARLEGELGALFCSAYPRLGFDWNVRSRGGPRQLVKSCRTMSFLNQLKSQAKALEQQQSARDQHLGEVTAQTEEACGLLLHYLQDLARSVKGIVKTASIAALR